VKWFSYIVAGAALLAPALPAAAQEAPLDDAGAGEVDREPVEEQSGPVEEQSGPWELEFVFGSYGRAQVSFDVLGNKGRSTNVVAHGPRIFESSYAEIELAQRFVKDSGFDALVLVTLALFDPVAHYSGIFGDQGWAIRNLYAETGGFVPALPGLRLWAGSRMYRGDDVYLLDWWPLDSLNTIGGGAIFAHRGLDVRLHVGVNRLEDDYQLQRIEVPGTPYGSQEMVLLDRQRLIASLRAGYTFEGIGGGPLGVKVLVYGEYHSLPAGERIPPDLVEGDTPLYPPEEITEELPADRGFVAGAQVGLFGFGEASHLNLFFRYARGIAAYGETGVPFGTTNAGTAEGAEEILGAVSGGWQSRWVGLLLGGYLRRFRDADVNRFDTDDFAEGAVAARLLVFATEHFQQGLELSYQRHFPFGIDERTDRHLVSGVFQLTVMEIVSVGRGLWDRPQIRLYYTLSVPNSAARRLHPPGDRRRPGRVEHLFYLGAEWWFNSSTY
jgi:maltoporin